MTDTIELPARLDLPAAETLLQTLDDHKGDLRFDATNVTQIGALCMQILVAASRRARDEDVVFDLIGLSQPVADQLAIMGCPAARLTKGEI